MELKLYIKQTQEFDESTGQPVYYAGSNPMTLNAFTGQLPVGSRRWRDFPNYIDVTDVAGNLNGVKLTWSTEVDETGQVIAGEFNQKKSFSGTIRMEGEAFKLIKAWLLDDVSSPLNCVDVEIEHVGCGKYGGYQIKSTDIMWCATDICEFDINLKQADEPLTCIKRTLISDNWQGWFPDNSQIPENGKKHPRFSYCNEQRPNGMMIMLWYIVNTFAGMMFTVMIPVILGYNAIIGTLIAIIAVINFLGGNITPPKVINQKDIFGPLGQFFVESAGCGREHPAPLIRDYIKNVCDKCGVKVDENTAPIFFANNWGIQTSDKNRGQDGFVSGTNPYYNACYLSPTVKRGIRRFKTLNVVVPPFSSNNPNTTSFWIPENAPLKTLDLFLDELNTLFNAKWRVQSKYVNGKLTPYLYIQRKDYWTDKVGSYVLDFVEGDAHKIVEGPCFEWTGKKTPAYINGLYSLDAADGCGREANSQMNDLIGFGDTTNNPTFQGKADLTSPYFGATKFRLDGASPDYIDDALQIVANGATLTPIPSYTYQLDQIAGFFEIYADYALLLQDETCTLPKILIWDEQSGYLNAKAAKQFAFIPGQDPVINPVYNKSGRPYAAKHEAETFVAGSGANLGSFPPFKYTVRTALGLAVITQKTAMLVNYPMYFESEYYDTLWDKFFWIDDPLKKPILNQTWSVKIIMCCDDLKTLKVFGDSSEIKLGEKVKLPLPYNQDGTITSIEASYDPDDKYGRYIELKGFV